MLDSIIIVSHLIIPLFCIVSIFVLVANLQVVLKNKGYGSYDIRLAFLELSFYTWEELEEITANKTTPIIARIVANQLMNAFKKTDWSKVKDIIEHIIGKPSQPLIQAIIEPTREEREKRLIELINMMNIHE